MTSTGQRARTSGAAVMAVAPWRRTFGRSARAAAALGLAATVALGAGVAFASDVSSSGAAGAGTSGPGAAPTNPAGAPVKLPTAKAPHKTPKAPVTQPPAPAPTFHSNPLPLPLPLPTPTPTPTKPAVPALPAFSVPVTSQNEVDPATGAWVPSDGSIAFGDFVQYVTEVKATPARRNLSNVTVTGYVPGYNPADTTTTQKAALVLGSAHCSGQFTCTVTADPNTGRVAFRLSSSGLPNGVLHGGSTGTVSFVVALNKPTAPVFTEGVYKATAANAAYLEWDQAVKAHGAAGLYLRHHRFVSNSVVELATLADPRLVNGSCTAAARATGCGVARLLDAGVPSRGLTSTALGLLVAGLMTVLASRRFQGRA